MRLIHTQEGDCEAARPLPFRADHAVMGILVGQPCIRDMARVTRVISACLVAARLRASV